MVGHSGMLEPTVKAIEAVDECLGEVVDLILAKGGSAIITMTQELRRSGDFRRSTNDCPHNEPSAGYCN